jgi:hypothetical protein
MRKFHNDNEEYYDVTERQNEIFTCGPAKAKYISSAHSIFSDWIMLHDLVDLDWRFVP